jgi:hypothetical protein
VSCPNSQDRNSAPTVSIPSSLKSCPNSQVSCPNSQDRNSAPTVSIPSSLKSCPNSQVSCPNSQDRNSAPTVRIPFTYYIRTNSSIHNTTATIPPTHPPSHPFFTELITASSTLDPTEQLLTLLSPNPAPTVRISLPILPQQSGSPYTSELTLLNSYHHFQSCLNSQDSNFLLTTASGLSLIDHKWSLSFPFSWPMAEKVPWVCKHPGPFVGTKVRSALVTAPFLP